MEVLHHLPSPHLTYLTSNHLTLRQVTTRHLTALRITFSIITLLTTSALFPLFTFISVSQFVVVGAPVREGTAALAVVFAARHHDQNS